MTGLNWVVVVLASYGLGCLVSGYYLVRWFDGRDIRVLGSGNAGARNVGRILGNAGFWAVLLMDAFKAALAVGAARLLVPSDGPLASLALLAMVSGHVWPVQLGFHGGKGVAPSLGGLLVLDWQVAAILASIFLMAYLTIRRTTLAGMLAYLLMPGIAFWLPDGAPRPLVLGVLSGIVLLAHRSNLRAELGAWCGNPTSSSASR